MALSMRCQKHGISYIAPDLWLGDGPRPPGCPECAKERERERMTADALSLVAAEVCRYVDKHGTNPRVIFVSGEILVRLSAELDRVKLHYASAGPCCLYCGRSVLYYKGIPIGELGLLRDFEVTAV